MIDDLSPSKMVNIMSHNLFLKQLPEYISKLEYYPPELYNGDALIEGNDLALLIYLAAQPLFPLGNRSEFLSKVDMEANKEWLKDHLTLVLEKLACHFYKSVPKEEGKIGNHHYYICTIGDTDDLKGCKIPFEELVQSYGHNGSYGSMKLGGKFTMEGDRVVYTSGQIYC